MQWDRRSKSTNQSKAVKLYGRIKARIFAAEWIDRVGKGAAYLLRRGWQKFLFFRRFRQLDENFSLNLSQYFLVDYLRSAGERRDNKYYLRRFEQADFEDTCLLLAIRWRRKDEATLGTCMRQPEVDREWN